MRERIERKIERQKVKHLCILYTYKGESEVVRDKERRREKKSRIIYIDICIYIFYICIHRKSERKRVKERERKC